ncbi:MAG TPA: ATP-binding protein [Gammaproteobacteria bacterium]|jgi:PAS domain S-box-containing protein
MSVTDIKLPSATRSAGRRWRPVSMVSLFGVPDYPGFVLTGLWFSVIAVSVVWPLADNGFIGPGFKWDNLPIHWDRYDLSMQLYLPWVVSVCLVMWLGLEWGAVPAYLATLFSRLYKDMPLDIAVVDSLHNALAMAVYFLMYCNYKGDYNLRSWRSWGWFALASLAAAMVSSIGAFISQFTGTNIGAHDLMSAWLGWWPNSFGLSLFICGPLILIFSPMVERAKLRYLGRAATHPFSQRELVLATSMFALLLVLFLVVDDQWAARRVSALMQMQLPPAVQRGIEVQFSTQRVAIWVLSLLLAGICLGGVFFTSRWAQRMRLRFDSETREARSALRRSEANFRNFFENNPAPMLLYDRETGEYVDVNQAAVERYGYTRTEFLELTIYDIRPQEDIAKVKAVMRDPEYRRQDFRHAGEWRHITKSGELIYVDVRVSALTIDNRALNLVLIYDVSPRKQAQVAVERRARELQSLAASSLEIAGAKTVDDILQACAERARELSGARIAISRYEPGHLRSSLADEFKAWREPGRLPDTESVWRVLLNKRFPQRVSAEEVKTHRLYPDFISRHGRIPIGAVLAVPLTRSDSEVVGALIVADKGAEDFDAEDETILVQLAQNASVGIETVLLREALETHMQELEHRVVERTSELDAFAYSVAHDLRAPLRAMHGFADAVREDYASALDEPGRDFLARIIKSAKNMDTLIQDLLAYSRIGREKAELTAVSLRETVQDAVADLQHEIASRSARVEVSVPPLTVLAHKATLKQVVVNLVSNALKFTAPGITPEVRIWAVALQGRVELCVRDIGIGIAPEHRERIFKVFERLHGSETYPGTGIGLSIVKKGLASMQGEINIESDGQGSTFHANLKEYRDG